MSFTTSTYPGTDDTYSYIQSRAEMNYELIDEYAAEMKRGTIFKATKAINVDGHKLIYDGAHRFEAAKAVSSSLLVEWKMGTEDEAQWLALAANTDHGLRRSPATKRRVTKNALLINPKLSNRKIAEHCQVDHKTVGKLRADLVASGEIPQMNEREVTRNGKTFTQKPKSGFVEQVEQAAKKDEAKNASLHCDCGQPVDITCTRTGDDERSRAEGLCPDCQTVSVFAYFPSQGWKLAHVKSKPTEPTPIPTEIKTAQANTLEVMPILGFLCADCEATDPGPGTYWPSAGPTLCHACRRKRQKAMGAETQLHQPEPSAKKTRPNYMDTPDIEQAIQAWLKERPPELHLEIMADIARKNDDGQRYYESILKAMPDAYIEANVWTTCLTMLKQMRAAARAKKAEPTYATVHDLESLVRAWLGGLHDQSLAADILGKIKARNPDGQRYLSEISKYVQRRGNAPHRRGDLHQACNNILDQMNQDQRRQKRNEHIATLVCHNCGEQKIKVAVAGDGIICSNCKRRWRSEAAYEKEAAAAPTPVTMRGHWSCGRCKKTYPPGTRYNVPEYDKGICAACLDEITQAAEAQEIEAADPDPNPNFPSHMKIADIRLDLKQRIRQLIRAIPDEHLPAFETWVESAEDEFQPAYTASA